MGRITDTVKALIIINVLFFIGSLAIGDFSNKLLALYPYNNPNFEWWQPFSSMFMHVNFLHLLFNMLALFFFGPPLENAWGRNKFLFFYFSAGLGAALIHSLVGYYEFHSIYDVFISLGYEHSQVINLINDSLQQAASNVTGEYSVNLPKEINISDYNNLLIEYSTRAMGASGAIMGLLVAFGMMYPNAELMLLFLPIPIKAKYFIPLLLAYEIISGITGWTSLFGIAIGHWAHIGGALFGFIMAYYWKKNSMNHTRWN